MKHLSGALLYGKLLALPINIRPNLERSNCKALHWSQPSLMFVSKAGVYNIGPTSQLPSLFQVRGDYLKKNFESFDLDTTVQLCCIEIRGQCYKTFYGRKL